MINFQFPTTYAPIPVSYLGSLSNLEYRIEGFKVISLEKKLQVLSAKLESIVREFHYKENDDYARVRLKQINLELDDLSKEIQGIGE